MWPGLLPLQVMHQNFLESDRYFALTSIKTQTRRHVTGQSNCVLCLLGCSLAGKGRCLVIISQTFGRFSKSYRRRYISDMKTVLKNKAEGRVDCDEMLFRVFDMADQRNSV